jgi:multidrug efflux pump subunit AcrB
MQIPNLSAFAVRERAVTLFLIIAIAAAGLFAFQRLGRAEDPSFTVKVMTVAVAWPGATAEEMQAQVADRLEKRLQEVAYFDRVETTARPGQVAMVVSFRDTTPPRLTPELFYQVRKTLTDEAVNLPRGVIGPFFNDEFSDVYFTLYAMDARGLPHRELVLEAERIRQRLLGVPGVLKVRILGEQPQRIYVEFSHARLATLGINGHQIADSLSRHNAVTGSGFVETDGPRVHLRLDGAFDSLDALRDVPVAAVEDRTLRLRDVAEVRRGYEEPPSYRIRNDGEPAVLIGVVMQPQWNGLKLGEALNAEERAIREALPMGLELRKIADQAKNIAYSYDEFMLKFAVALGVVMAVSFATLGFRVGLVVAAAVPLTLAVVFVIMLATGRNFDRITLGALILSLGLLVDDAIIAIEMMVVKMEEGLDRISAATFAWNATAAPMLTGTLVTIIGFTPIGFAQSSAGEYAGNIFWIVAFALLASWLVAVLFTPYLGVKLLPAIPPKPGGHDAIYASRRYEQLRRLIRACVDRRRMVIGLTVAAFGLSVAAMGVVKKQFFPSSDRPEVLIEVALPQGSAFSATESVIRRLETDLSREPEAEIVTSYIGAGAARFFLSLNPEQPDPAFGKIVVRTPDAKARAALSKKIARWIEAGRYAEARVRVDRLLFGPPVPYPVVFRVVGTDLSAMRKTAAEVRDILQTAPELTGVHLEWGERALVQRLAFDPARLRVIGLTPQDAANQLQTLLNGVTVTQVREGIRTIDVVMRAVDAERADLDGLADLTLTTRDGRSVPLSHVARLVPDAEEPVLKRRSRELYIAVRADVAAGVQPPDATAAVLPRLAPVKAALPAGVRIDTGGSVEESGKANAALAAVFPVMIILMLATIMAQVRSFSGMFMVFVTAPLGLVGAAPALLLFNQPFGFNAILGLIGLAGILMRNTLILVDQIRRDQDAGLSDYDAIIEATVRRARPVILTALAAMLAFVPLTFSSFWGPLAYTLIGGVLVGTILTLLFLPALYAAWFRVRAPGETAPAALQKSWPGVAKAIPGSDRSL